MLGLAHRRAASVSAASPAWRSLARRHASVSGRQSGSAAFPFLSELGLSDGDNLGVYNGEWFGSGPVYTSINPADGRPIASVRAGSVEDYEKVVRAMDAAKKEWSDVPAPARGEIVRQIGEELRAKKEPLGKLIALEMGKIYVEVRLCKRVVSALVADFRVDFRLGNACRVSARCRRESTFVTSRWASAARSTGLLSRPSGRATL